MSAYLRTIEALGAAAGAGVARPLDFAQALEALETRAADWACAELRAIAARVAGDCRAEPLSAARLLRRAGDRLGSLGRAGVMRPDASAEYSAASNALLDCANAIAGSAP